MESFVAVGVERAYTPALLSDANNHPRPYML